MKKFYLYNRNMVLALLFTLFLSFVVSSCQQELKDTNINIEKSINNVSLITEQEVFEIQKSWGDGIVQIGKVYLEKGDYKTVASEHIRKFYNYENGKVLFKPTLVSEKQFRNDFEGALSYFVAGDKNYPEDHGFAIKPWSAVRWENIGTTIKGEVALAMGNYYFRPAKGGDVVKVEYSFAYIKDKDGKLKIILHDSHIPYKPVEKH